MHLPIRRASGYARSKQFTRRSSPYRLAAVIDSLVWLLALATFLFWLAGNVYLVCYPVPPTSTLAIVDSDSLTAERLASEATKPALSPDSPNQEIEQVENQLNDSKKAIADYQHRLAALQRQLEDYKKQAQAEPMRPSPVGQQDLESLQQRIREITSQQIEATQNHERAVLDLQSQLRTEVARNQKLLVQLDNMSDASQRAERSSLSQPTFRNWAARNGREKEMAFVRRTETGLLIFIGKDDVVYTVVPDQLLPADLNLIEASTR